MKYLLYIITILTFFTSISFAQTDFTDIENHWAKEYIKSLAEDTIVSGYQDNTFRPNESIKIQDFLKILLEQDKRRLIKSGDKYPNWYIQTAFNDKIVLPNQITDFSKPLKRGEMAQILCNYLCLDDVVVDDTENSFTDLSKENENTVLKLINLDIVSGYKDNTFKEENNVTRAEACKVLDKVYKIRYDLINNRTYELTSNNTNIGKAKATDDIKDTRYEITDDGICFLKTNNDKTYANFIYPKYISQNVIIKLIKSLIDDYSYVYVNHIDDELFQKTINIIYGTRESYISSGSNGFQITLYEDKYYDLRKETDVSTFSNKIFCSIKLGKTFDRLSDYKENGFSKRYLYKLEKAFSVLVGEKYKKEILDYIIECRSKARSISDNEFDVKLKETKKFGNYKINVLCTHGDMLSIYLEKI